MSDPKADALLKAAHAGNVVKVGALLAAGAPVEATDVNRMTPVMLAAQGRHADTFHALVEAGANLHALAFRQLDLLEVAARGGNVAIVRFLLEQGLPVNGHWQPANETLRRMGHDTPLLQAAAHGQVEVVRVLLAAGANPKATYQGKTALDQVRDCLRDLSDADERQPYREIAALLGDAPAADDRSLDTELRAAKMFAANAQKPGYLELRAELTARCGAARPWTPLPDHGVPAAAIVAFRLAGCKRQKTLDDLQQAARQAGCQLLLAEPWAPGEDAALVLFATDNQFAVVLAVGTEGANYGVQTADIIAWLRQLHEENPFHLVYCNHEMIGGTFVGPIKSAKQLAERMISFCPSCLDGGFEDAGELAAALKKRRSFLLRWD